MKFGKKTIVTSMAVSLALILGACGNDDAAEPAATEETDQAATETEETPETTETETTETEGPKQLAGGPLQDGTYTLEEKEISDKGWKATFSIAVTDGKITESNYNYVDADGKLKTDDEAYQKNMSDKTGVGPKDYIPALNDDLVAKQDAQQVEIVTGATHSSESFMNYAQQLIQAAQAGDTETIIIDAAAPLQDGEYSLEEKNIGATGWKTVFKMTVENGKITKSDFANFNAEGMNKLEDEAYQKNMSEKAGVGPKEYFPALNDQLVEKQSAAGVEVVTGATHSTHTFKLYAEQLINAAQKGDTTPIVVDNIVFEKQ
ncbi:extracellular electron transfer flavoprotein PplA [Niallia sp. Krafla_26]|uniref:extracellular electron transfer flavoprotein PplA n=1 Tax=Niallia sp. Krafla_26 TaxID=3064703 RepID=UPI003D171294